MRIKEVAGIAERLIKLNFTAGLIIFTAAVVEASAGNETTMPRYKSEIAPYVEFLRNNTQSPVDYVMSLFDKYDVVIIAERDHREYTQWNFIYDLVSDPRFIDKVGNMFTEYGSVYQQSKLESFLNDESMKPQKIIEIMRDFLPSPEGWNRNSFYDFLQKLYKLDKSLPADKKISLFLSDQPESWDSFNTAEKYSIFYAMPGGGDFINPRDRIMAMRVYTKLQDMKQSDNPRKKALVIMNSRHAFDYIPQLDEMFGFIGQNTGGFLFKWMPGKVANVMMNTVSAMRGMENPIQDGKWDAAFAVNGNKPSGFNFKGSPFGKDSFDYGQIKPDWGAYQDIFTGMVFYTPLNGQMLYENIPGFYTDDYRKIVLKRAEIAGGEKTVNETREYWKKLENKPEDFYKKLYPESINSKINKWLESQP